MYNGIRRKHQVYHVYVVKTSSLSLRVFLKHQICHYVCGGNIKNLSVCIWWKHHSLLCVWWKNRVGHYVCDETIRFVIMCVLICHDFSSKFVVTCVLKKNPPSLSLCVWWKHQICHSCVVKTSNLSLRVWLNITVCHHVRSGNIKFENVLLCFFLQWTLEQAPFSPVSTRPYLTTVRSFFCGCVFVSTS